MNRYKTNTVIVLLIFVLCLFGQIAHADEEKAYYYNPDGGKYIHSNPQCSTISSKYWPIMEQIALERLKEPEYKEMRLCSTCCAEKNNAAAFFRGKQEVEGCFDVTQKAEENLDFYTFCYENSLSYLVADIGERDEEYKKLVDGWQGRWGYPDDGDITREMALAIAYAALQEYVGIGDDDLPLYFADPWLDVQSYDYHEWFVRINKAVCTYRFYNSHGYYFYINADNGLISKIEKY